MRKAIGWVGGIKKTPADAGGLVVQVIWGSAAQSFCLVNHVLHSEAELLQARSWRNDLKTVSGGRIEPFGIILPGMIDDCNPI